MPIKVTCPACASTMTVPDAAAGRFGTCRKCDTRLRVPMPTVAAEPGIDFDDPLPETTARSTTAPVRSAAVAAPPPKTLKQQYAEVPFYRRNGPVSILVLLGFFFGLPLIPACAIVATGDVYQTALGDDGKLMKWGTANRFIAIFLLFAWAAVVVYFKRT